MLFVEMDNKDVLQSHDCLNGPLSEKPDLFI